MTIFQKMLAVPVLALLLYSGFSVYSYIEYQRSSDSISVLRDAYLPLLEIVNDNLYLFDQIRTSFKDAVLADEPDWLPNSELQRQAISNNLQLLMQHENLIDPDAVSKLQQSFDLYYTNASLLAASILSDQKNVIDDSVLVQNVERYHNDAAQQFAFIKQGMQQRFRQMLNETDAVMDNLLFVGGVISIVIMCFILTVTLIVSISTRRNVYQVIQRMRDFAQGSTDFSRRLQRKNKDELGYLIYWFNKLSDKLEQDYKLLQTVSITDKLTQLNNRCRTDAYLPEVLLNAQRAGRTIAVLLLDIDHFKMINDSFGHLAGDAVLRQFADILKQHANEHDFLARWGGEEFIVLLPDVDVDQAFNYAEQLRLKVAQHNFPLVEQVSVSCGVAMSQPTDNAEGMVKRADDCLYQAKRNGRNCVVVERC